MDAQSHWTLGWADRPSEEAKNLNPAFCGELIARTVGEFHKARRAPLNFATAFTILPLVLHKPTRDSLPGRANAVFAGWVAEHNPIVTELPDRAGRLWPISREALLFAIHHQLLMIEDGGLVPGGRPLRPTAKSAPTTDDVDEARSAAALLGRWFANQRSQPSVLQGLGITP